MLVNVLDIKKLDKQSEYTDGLNTYQEAIVKLNGSSSNCFKNYHKIIRFNDISGDELPTDVIKFICKLILL